MNPSANQDTAREAIQRAEVWLDRANETLTAEEKGIQDQMQRLLAHPLDKVVLTKLIDQGFRSHDPERVADQINSVLRRYGVPDFFPRVERLLVQMFLGLGRYFPALTVPRLVERMRHDSSRAILPGEPEALGAHLKKRRQDGLRMNINHLGEAILGEGEARRRFDTYLDDLRNPEIEYISVKISTLYSQVRPLAFDDSVRVLVDRLSNLFRTAAENEFRRGDGTVVPKFVNLDMEEYRDLEITMAAFRATLERRDLRDFSAGIVLQAYLPESYIKQGELTEWAKARVASGGAPIKLRIVKGANLETEKVEAILHNWPLAPFDNKLDVDANYRRMVIYGMRPENIRAVHLGIASHNLFELAFASVLGDRNGVRENFYFEMLEGMADHVCRALNEMGGDVLLYAPVASKAEFIHAIAYLVRRLDENTAPENFLRFAPKLTTDSEAWDFLKEQFLASFERLDHLDSRSHRLQDRNKEVYDEGRGTNATREFVNEPDTDWSLAPNRKWAEGIRARWCRGTEDEPILIPVVVDGEEVFGGRMVRDSFDPSQPERQICVARSAQADTGDIDRAVAVAAADPDGWREESMEDRHRVLSQVAVQLRRARGDLIGAAAANTGKVFAESDPEVSEAIDFAEYYPLAAREFTERPNIRARARGVGCVISPWNFPIAIPCGGIAAALAAGNTVLFKPATEAVLVGWELCRCFWKAGISRKVLQFVPGSGGETGRRLVNHPGVDFVILTGGTATALRILEERPDLFLSAETGGKNATIVTAMSDRDQAIKNVLHSAFSHGGQKCSATSLLILEREVYRDPHFRDQLVDAVRSLPVGSAWEFRHAMGPLIHAPEGDLKRAIERLEPGESWLLPPRNLESNPRLWSPGIKWDVQPGSFTYLTELFGPVLGVMEAEDLEHAIDLVNGTGYGLTSGLESLDQREQEFWRERIRAGNLYINRVTTGAITLRQPFGGTGKSAVGPAIKAGSPNYPAFFMDFQEMGFPPATPLPKDDPWFRLAREWKQKIRWGELRPYADDLYRTARAIQSYLANYEHWFSREWDYFHLRGQDNIFRFRPIGLMVVRVTAEDSLFEVLARVAAARICRNPVVLSLPESLANDVTSFLDGLEGRKFLQGVEIRRESDVALSAGMDAVGRIRYAHPERVPAVVFRAAAKHGHYIVRAPVLMEGRIELLHYLQNQSISHNYHRYGNLGERGLAPEYSRANGGYSR